LFWERFFLFAATTSSVAYKIVSDSGAKPFSFGNIQPPAAAPANEEAEDEEDKPPKVEFKQVIGFHND